MGRDLRSLRLYEKDEFSRKWNMLLDELQRRDLTVVPPLILEGGISGGQRLAIMRDQGTSEITTEPFAIESAIPNLTVYPGLVNGALPTGWDTVFTVSAVGVYYVKLNLTTDGQSITAAALAVDGTAVDPIPVVDGSAPTAFSFLLGVLSSGTLYQVHTGNLTFTPSRVFVKEKTGGAGIGESPYDFGYTWLKS